MTLTNRMCVPMTGLMKMRTCVLSCPNGTAAGRGVKTSGSA